MNSPQGYSGDKGPLAWMAGNSVAANLLMAVLLIGGLLLAMNVKQEVFPEFSMDMVNVSVSYPGASPEEVEQGIVLAVEDAIENLEGIKEISSEASQGSARVSIEVRDGYSVNRLWQEIKSEIDRIRTFPEEAEEPEVTIGSREREVVSLVLSGTRDDLVLRQQAEKVRDRLLLKEHITRVELQGVRDYEIHVEVSQDRLRQYGLTLQDIADKVASSSVDLGAGEIETSGGDILLRMKELRSTAGEYGDIPIIARPDGTRILLSDIAEVREGFEDSEAWAAFNGSPGIMIQVYRVGNQTPSQVAKEAREVADRLNRGMPGDLQLSVTRNMAEVFGQRADLLLKNAFLGLGLVFLCLALFLEARLAFWVSLGIPVSFLGSFLFLAGTDFSVNMVTMFAFIVTLGIVVDDAIVVGENVHHHRRLGKGGIDAAIQGTREVAMPVTFSVLTNMLAFLPLFFVSGFMGKIFKYIPMVVIAVFLVSLVESLFVLPAHLAHIKEKKVFGPFASLSGVQSRFSRLVERFITNGFYPALGLALRHRYIVLSFALALLIGTAGFVQSRMGLVLFPETESDFAYAEAVLPTGSPQKRIREVEERLREAAADIIRAHGEKELSEGIFSRVNGDTIRMRVFLTDPSVRPLPTSEFTRRWRSRTGEVAGLESIRFAANMAGPGSGKDLTVRLSHRDRDLLQQAGKDLAGILGDYSGVHDIDDGSAQGKQQFDIRITPLGERMGLRSRDVADRVRNAFSGAVAKRQLRDQNEVTVRVWFPESERISRSRLEDMVLQAPEGKVLLREAARLVPGRAYTSIERVDGRRTLSVTANVTPQTRTSEISASLKEKAMPELVQEYSGLSSSFQGKQAEMRESVTSLLNGLILAFIGIYALLAIPFRSYVQPLIIMSCLPFGLIGAVFGHLLLGYGLSVMSLFGMVALCGVVINDSLVLIDFANRNTREGKDLLQAVQTAATQRFRPIILTTLTTFGGLAPMIFETSLQARFLIPMALSLGFGLVFGTFVILILVPCIFLLLEDLRKLLAYPHAQAQKLTDTE